MHAQPEHKYNQTKKLYDEIKYNDELRDYSYNALTKDEKTEIALFHSFKQDPYYKHYIYNHLRKFAENEDEVV